ncbi:MAG: hypothetical protein WD894_00275 [Pirellulales bacterium]
MYKMLALLVLIAAIAVGCGRRQSDPDNDAELTAVGEQYLIEQEPADAQPVAEAIQGEDEAEVTVVGRIGGEENPWVEDLAAFTIVDPSLKACSDIPGDMCEKPWDYCCESPDTLQTHSVTVKFADEKGTIVPVDARKLFGVEPLQTVVIKGKLRKDKSGKTAVVAEKMYVKR